MSLYILASFWSVATLFILTPGADWACAISAGSGGRQYIPAVMGMAAGHLMATLLVATGLGIVMGQIPAAITLMTLAGAGYLIWTGQTLLRQPAMLLARDKREDFSWRRWALKGFMVSGLNPKVFLLFLALLPQFADQHSSWPLAMQFLTLGLLEVFTCCVVYLFIGFCSRVMLGARPRAAQVISKISGAFMVIIGVVLVCNQAEKLFL